tara:strand:- start:2001 stop:2264 length:264 start_codon:yes stop_codon:yes gene_type:complete
MITKTQITDIIHRYSYNVEDQVGNHLIVVDDDDWDEIAQKIVETFPIADVVGSEERAELVCEFCGTNKAEVCFKCHTNECVSAAGQN